MPIVEPTQDRQTLHHQRSISWVVENATAAAPDLVNQVAQQYPTPLEKIRNLDSLNLGVSCGHKVKLRNLFQTKSDGFSITTKKKLGGIF